MPRLIDLPTKINGIPAPCLRAEIPAEKDEDSGTLPEDDDEVAWSTIRKGANREAPVSLLEAEPFIFEGQSPTDIIGVPGPSVVHLKMETRIQGDGTREKVFSTPLNQGFAVPEVQVMQLASIQGPITIRTPEIGPNVGNSPLTTEALRTHSMKINNVWRHWVTSGNTCDTCVTINGTSWPTQWLVGSVTSGTTSVNSFVWTKWVQDSVEYQLDRNSGEVGVYIRGRAQEVLQKTPEQIAAEEATIRLRAEENARYQLAYTIENEKRIKAEKVAKARARKLLVSCLNAEQKACYAKNGYFDVMVGSKTYRIHQGTHGNVRLLDEKGNSKVKYCAQPDGVPDEDAMLAQKLALEFGEEAFLKVANATNMRN